MCLRQRLPHTLMVNCWGPLWNRGQPLWYWRPGGPDEGHAQIREPLPGRTAAALGWPWLQGPVGGALTDPPHRQTQLPHCSLPGGPGQSECFVGVGGKADDGMKCCARGTKCWVSWWDKVLGELMGQSVGWSDGKVLGELMGWSVGCGDGTKCWANLMGQTVGWGDRM